jgi:hypothetical protein
MQKTVKMQKIVILRCERSEPRRMTATYERLGIFVAMRRWQLLHRFDVL